MPDAASAPGLTVAAFYRFTALDGRAAWRARLLEQAVALDLRGTILLAEEGLNGTIAGDAAAIAAMVATLRALPGCADMEVKYSAAAAPPFARIKVRLKREIITMGAPLADPAAAGVRVAPADWNALIADPATILIDTRNAYETAVGGFAGAIDPGLARFGDFPAWFDAFAATLAPEDRARPIAMFCTGGIRCEKSTAYARAQGFADVRHLSGGILKYLEDVPAADSLWSGDCYVFDERVALGQGLAAGSHHMCRTCGAAVTDLDAHAAQCRAIADLRGRDAEEENIMEVQIFRGAGRAFACVAAGDERILPARFGPWTPFKTLMLARGTPQPGLNVAECLDDIAAHGIHLTDAHVRIAPEEWAGRMG